MNNRVWIFRRLFLVGALVLGILSSASALELTFSNLENACALAIGGAGTAEAFKLDVAYLTSGLGRDERGELLTALQSPGNLEPGAVDFILRKLLINILKSDTGPLNDADWVDHVAQVYETSLSSIERAQLEKAITTGPSISRQIQEPSDNILPRNERSSIDGRFSKAELDADYAVIKRLLIDARSSNAEPLLSVVIPSYKEASRLPPSLKQIKRFLAQYPIPVEVLVMVEKLPNDQTLAAAAQVNHVDDSQIHVIDNQIWGGKGYAVRSGMKRAKGDYVLFMDTDLATPLPEILKALRFMAENRDTQVLIGNRNNPKSDYFKNRDPLRKAMSSVFIGLTRQVLAMPEIADTQCGFKMFTQNASQSIFAHQRENGFSFDVEVLLLAKKLQFKVSQLDIFWTEVKEGSTVNPFLEPFRMLRDLLKVKKEVERNLKEDATKRVGWHSSSGSNPQEAPTWSLLMA